MRNSLFRVSPARLAVALVAAVLIAVCAWCAGIYAAGGDPLAFLSSELFNTVADDQASDAGQAGSASTAWSPSVEDIDAALRDLAYDGDDVSLDAEEEPSVVVSSGGVWVESKVAGDLVDAAELSARRTAALASWLADQGADGYRVTWIAEDASGSVIAAYRMDASQAPASGDLAELVAACSAYRFSNACFDALSASGIAQASGEAPVLPDGSEIPFREASGSNGSSASGVSQEQGSDTASASGGSSDGRISVAITVDGSSVGAGSSSANLSLAAGSTVYDALLATGISVNAQSTAYGIYVSAIAGLAEKEHGDMSGWVYTVNGNTINTSASNYVLSDGDQVRWFYVTS